MDQPPRNATFSSCPFYTILGILPSLAIHRDAAEDLQAINAAGDRADHAAILAFLQQAKCEPGLLETMTEDWFGADEVGTYSVCKVVSLHKAGKKLWRVKVLTLKGLVTQYRVLYTFSNDRQNFYVLGVVHRDFAYERTHPRIRRLLAAYDRLGIT